MARGTRAGLGLAGMMGAALLVAGCGDDDSAAATTTTTTTVATTTTTEPETVHVVESGETLGIIAQRYGSTVAAIAERNDLADPDVLAVGQELVIPGAGATTTTSTIAAEGSDGTDDGGEGEGD